MVEEKAGYKITFGEYVTKNGRTIQIDESSTNSPITYYGKILPYGKQSFRWDSEGKSLDLGSTFDLELSSLRK